MHSLLPLQTKNMYKWKVFVINFTLTYVHTYICGISRDVTKKKKKKKNMHVILLFFFIFNAVSQF